MLNRNTKLSVVIALATCTFLSYPAYADDNFSVQRLYGSDRYETCSNIANYFQQGQLDSVIVASGEQFADALSAGCLQKLGNYPIMLVGKNIKSSDKTLGYIENHLKKEGTIYILGGEASVNSEFERYFKEKGFNKIIRLGGKDRYETNVKIVSKVDLKEGTPVIVANGDNFPDALSIASIASYKGYPVFITPSENLPNEIEEKIREIKPSNIYVIGGISSVSSNIESKLKEVSQNVVRIEGKDRYETSINICKYFNKDLKNLVVASGENFPDALSGIALSAKFKAPIVITDESNVEELKSYIQDQKVNEIVILGGENMISKNLEDILNPLSLKSKAQDFMTCLLNKKIDEAVKGLSTDLKSEYGESIMKSCFSSMSFKGMDTKPLDIKQEKLPLGNMVTLTYKVEGLPTNVDIKIKYDNDEKVYDFTSEATPGESNYKLPTYVNTDNFTEENVAIGDEKYKLPGVLSIPKGKGPFPAVVLVHGSGANDMDETYGDTKVFKDISAGLASKGIAVLRYNKRSNEYPSLTAIDTKLDLNKETVNDAVDAVKLLKKTEGIDSSKVFVLGHSQGAMLTPTILKDCGNSGAAGGIMMAGPVDFLDTLLEQSKYLNSIGYMDEDNLKYIQNLYDLVKNNKDFPENISENTMIFHAYPYYWLSVKNSTQVQDAVDIKDPLLILQGKRDYQVAASNLEKWKSMLKDKQNIEYNSYDKLNHFFIEGEGKMTPEEYGKGNIPKYIIDDIVSWISKYSK
ncbi:N-acetylmuramoyl-L-alanine amidase LytC precursor [Clostridium ragsdalei P11]|uniref:N-acetylmuramoyl-L-alanine amidase LytC n=1 Tax=Clostridium ragsdalei P11 TaxID=1353534 RepID=A0A1A6B4B4_9CLOT|nr:cell wall-binding repeat-containing protein [Clostridium ragsdalei]OBR97142.1 N-acetylmuramoyl-L-alanine amidase LytC precursor [Clostridium ragsdalei P11]